MIFTKPYPPSQNKSPVWIDRQGDDLFMYFSPRGDPNPVFDRFVGYYTDFVYYNPFLASSLSPAPIAPTLSPAPIAPTLNTNTQEPTPDDPVVSYTLPTEQKQVREGNDLVLYYPNGSVDRYRNYFAPTAGTVAGPVPTDCGWVKTPVSTQQVGNDQVVSFTDGTQKVLTGFYLPKVPDPAILNGNAYAFGTTSDPECMVSKGITPPLKWLVRDQQNGMDRVQVYSDGTSRNLLNWYTLNPGYSTVGLPSVPVTSFVPDDPRLDLWTPDPDLYIADPRNAQPSMPSVGVLNPPGIVVTSVQPSPSPTPSPGIPSPYAPSANVTIPPLRTDVSGLPAPLAVPSSLGSLVPILATVALILLIKD